MEQSTHAAATIPEETHEKPRPAHKEQPKSRPRSAHEKQPRSVPEAPRETRTARPRAQERALIRVAAASRAAPHGQADEMDQPEPTPSRPFESVSVDLFTDSGRTFLVYTDRLSGFPLLTEWRDDPDSSEVIQVIRGYFVQTGVPTHLRSDGGPQYMARRFHTFLKRWGVLHDKSTPHYAQSNGHAEASVKALKNLVATAQRMPKGTSPSYDDDFLHGLLELRNYSTSGWTLTRTSTLRPPPTFQVPRTPLNFRARMANGSERSRQQASRPAEQARGVVQRENPRPQAFQARTTGSDPALRFKTLGQMRHYRWNWQATQLPDQALLGTRLLAQQTISQSGLHMRTPTRACTTHVPRTSLPWTTASPPRRAHFPSGSLKRTETTPPPPQRGTRTRKRESTI